MKKLALVGALVLIALPALAQNPPGNAPPAKPPSPEQLAKEAEQSQGRMIAAQADYYLAVAKQLQQRLTESATHAADTARWWESWWAGMYPPAAPAAKQPDKK